jgi:plasminogen activator inhibitor 1 RNA-binding protein
VGQPALEENNNVANKFGVIDNEKRERYALWKEGRNKVHDRHSRTGIFDNEKKTTMGWGEAGTAELQGANDVLDPKDPDAPESNRFNADEAAEENFKTLDQYLKEKKDVHVPTLQPRKPNEGSDDSQWKDAVALQKEEDNYFIGKEEAGSKSKNKSKKGKVYLEIDQPAHRSGGRNQGGRNYRGRQHAKRGEQASLNLSDVSAFPTLGA